MACDLQFTLNNQIKVKGKTKIYKFQPNEQHFEFEEFMIGFCGAASEIVDIVDFYERPDLYKDMPRCRNLQGLVLTASGKLFQFDRPDKWLAVNAPYAAMGTGAPTALGAMHMGASPKQAVEAASKVCPFTGMGIKVYNF